MRNLWREMSDLLARGERFVTATIFSRSGSAPRTAGAKMIIKADGSTSGTIGGGKLEWETILLAREVLQSRQPRLVNFDLTGARTEDMDMICGGTGEVLLDYHDAGAGSSVEIYAEIVRAIKNQQKCWLITCFPRGEQVISCRQQCLVKPDGTLVGLMDLDPGFMQKLITGPAKICIHADVLEQQRVLVEPVRDPGTVYIFGAGHISRQIVPVARGVDFETVVLDDRAEFASPERFPHSRLILLDSLHQPLPELPIDGNSYLVIVTRGHLHDKNVLGQLLRKPAAYLGMIGSRRKRDLIYAALEKEGFTREELLRVHSPIGIDILAETPQEIAVSIVAELIRVRAQREKNDAHR